MSGGPPLKKEAFKGAISLGVCANDLCMCADCECGLGCTCNVSEAETRGSVLIAASWWRHSSAPWPPWPGSPGS